jgi:hypothetical protein
MRKDLHTMADPAGVSGWLQRVRRDRRRMRCLVSGGGDHVECTLQPHRVLESADFGDAGHRICRNWWMMFSYREPSGSGAVTMTLVAIRV